MIKVNNKKKENKQENHVYQDRPLNGRTKKVPGMSDFWDSLSYGNGNSSNIIPIPHDHSVGTIDAIFAILFFVALLS